MSRSVQKAPYRVESPYLVRVYRMDHLWVGRTHDQGGDHTVYRNTADQTPLRGRVDSGHNNALSPFLGSDSDRNTGHVEEGWDNDLGICHSKGHGMEVGEDSDRSTYAQAPRDERSDRRILADVDTPSPRIGACRHVPSARAWGRWGFLGKSMHSDKMREGEIQTAS